MDSEVRPNYSLVLAKVGKPLLVQPEGCFGLGMDPNRPGTMGRHHSLPGHAPDGFAGGQPPPAGLLIAAGVIAALMSIGLVFGAVPG